MKSLSRAIATAEPSQTLALSALAKKLHAEGVDVETLTASEPDFPTPVHIKEAAKKASEPSFTTHTHDPGIPELRQAIAEKFRRDNGLRFDSSQILVSNGAKHSSYNTLKAICNKGDEVIIPPPYWVSYPQMVTLVDAKPVFVLTTEEDGFRMRAGQLRQAVTKKTKALLFCTPANQTGSVYSQEEIEGLAHVVEETDTYVIADEVYEKVISNGAKHFSRGFVPGTGFGSRDHVRISFACSMSELEKAAERVERGLRKLQ